MKRRMPTEEDRVLAKKALERMEAELEGKETLTDYEHNLRVVLRAGVVSFRTAGLAASLLPAYSRLLGEEIRRQRWANRAATSQHVGTVSKRQVFKGLVLEAVISIDTDFGGLHIHRFVDESGNVLVWKTGTTKLEEGYTYSVKGTVKEHGDYKGCKQTLLTRCAVQEKSNESIIKEASK